MKGGSSLTQLCGWRAQLTQHMKMLVRCTGFTHFPPWCWLLQYSGSGKCWCGPFFHSPAVKRCSNWTIQCISPIFSIFALSEWVMENGASLTYRKCWLFCAGVLSLPFADNPRLQDFQKWHFQSHYNYRNAERKWHVWFPKLETCEKRKVSSKLLPLAAFAGWIVTNFVWERLFSTEQTKTVKCQQQIISHCTHFLKISV